MSGDEANQAMSYEEARAEVQRSLNGVSNCDAVALHVKTLRALLAGPPEPSEEEVANCLLSVALHACQPGRGDVFGWLEDNIAPFAAHIQQLFRSRR